MQARTILRNGLGIALVQKNGAYKNRVYLQRAAKLEAGNLPAICVFTNGERTQSMTGTDTYRQVIELEVQAYVRRDADQLVPHKNVDGMPAQPVQYAPTAQFLDEICGDVEQVVFEMLNKGKVEYSGETLCLENNQEVNTRIEQDEDGEAPFLMASLTFSIEYTKEYTQCFEYCNFTNYGLQIL